jgi:hypothetical protein
MLILSYILLIFSIFQGVAFADSRTSDDYVISAEGGELFEIQSPQIYDIASLKKISTEFCGAKAALIKNCHEQLLRRFLKSSYSENANHDKMPWFEEEVVKMSFTSDIVRAVCDDETLSSVYGNRAKCLAKVRKGVRSVKMYLAYTGAEKLAEMVNKSELIPQEANWMNNVEGHTFAYKDKVSLMQSTADDPRVETICEIGFNFGHSVRSTLFAFAELINYLLQSINWLTANPKARIVAFDLVRRLYVSSSVNGLNQMFPGRRINLIAGAPTP